MKVEIDDDLIAKLTAKYDSINEPLTKDGVIDHDAVVEVVEDYIERGIETDFAK